MAGQHFIHRVGTTRTVIFLGIIGLSATAARGQSATEVVIRIGMCDASAAVPLGKDKFLVANDEDNVLRVYPRAGDHGPEPLQAFDTTAFLELESEKSEADFEGAATLGERTFWITSHARNKNGALRPNRYRFFATQWQPKGDGGSLFFAGRPYRNLLDDMLAEPRLSKYGLAAAAAQAPKTPGAMNIEGLCVAPDGAALWIGFRNPIPQGKALIVPLTNPNEIIDGKRAKLGDPIELDLGGLGIRSIEYWSDRKEYLIIAGEIDTGDRFRAYRWSGKSDDAPQAIGGIDFNSYNPEGLVLYPGESTRFQIVSDDGTKTIDGVECKESPDVSRRSFRTAWFQLP